MIYIIFNEYFLNKNIQEEIKLNKKNFNIKFLNIFWKASKYNSLSYKIIQKFFKTIGLDKYCLNFLDVKKQVFDKEDIVIYFDIFQKEVIEILRNYTKETKEIFWLWNKLENKEIKYLKKISNNIWTFDKGDSENFNLKYYPQFYWYGRETENIKFSENKLFFIGQDKGRIERIYEIDKKIDISTEILIQKNRFKIYKKKYKKYLLKKNIDYKEIIKKVKQSNILLEICKKDQTGLTLRTLEALFFNKKLITNNLTIKNYDFYHPNNIFILDDKKSIDENMIEKINEFLKKEKIIVPMGILKKYTIENWLKTLIKR